nr:vimentin type intermediate filament associated [Hymenolepis microstoma]
MWVFGGGDAAQKSSIEEANKHLSAMAQKIEELEKIVEDQKKELIEKEELSAQCIKQYTDNHYAEVGNLNAKIKDQASTIRTLQDDLKRRDAELNVLRQRARMLDEVMRYKASLAKLTITLEQAEQYSRSLAGRVGLNDNRFAVTNCSGNNNVSVFTDPAPRFEEQSGARPPYYLVDEVPDDELVDKVGEAYVNAEKRNAAKENGKPTLAEKANSKLFS